MSYASLPYFGVNSFKFTNAKGDSTFVRYQMEPEGDAPYLTKEQSAVAGPNSRGGNSQTRRQRPGAHKAACPGSRIGDKIEDPSIAWPDSRKTVELGVVEIEQGRS